MPEPVQLAPATQITIRPPGQFFEGEGLSLGDAVDTINPLQHIPFVSTLYRNLTGDTRGAGSTLLGGAIFGGPIGFIAGLADVIFESATGNDVGTSVLAALSGETENPNIQVASNQTNLGDFAGDARRNICKQNCTLQEPLIAQAEQASAPVELASAAPQEILPPSLSQQPQSRAASIAVDAAQHKKDQEILSLFGGTTQTKAAASYSQASMRDVLRGASVNAVL